jgi:hypothetical protein
MPDSAVASYGSPSAGIALLYAIKCFVQVALERFEFAAIDGRALLRGLPVHVEAKQACGQSLPGSRRPKVSGHPRSVVAEQSFGVLRGLPNLVGHPFAEIAVFGLGLARLH